MQRQPPRALRLAAPWGAALDRQLLAAAGPRRGCPRELQARLRRAGGDRASPAGVRRTGLRRDRPRPASHRRRARVGRARRHRGTADQPRRLARGHDVWDDSAPDDAAGDSDDADDRGAGDHDARDVDADDHDACGSDADHDDACADDDDSCAADADDHDADDAHHAHDSDYDDADDTDADDAHHADADADYDGAHADDADHDGTHADDTDDHGAGAHADDHDSRAAADDHGARAAAAADDDDATASHHHDAATAAPGERCAEAAEVTGREAGGQAPQHGNVDAGGADPAAEEARRQA